MKTELFVDTFLLMSLELVNIQNIPFLSSSTIVTIDSNWGSFSIFVTFDLNNFAVGPIGELVFAELENLEPL